MNVIAKHYKKDRDVLQSRIFGISAHSFSAEGSGVAERSIARFLVPVAKPNDDEGGGQDGDEYSGEHSVREVVDKLMRREEKSASLNDAEDDVGDKGERRAKGALDKFVRRDEKNAAIDWQYVAAEEPNAKKRASNDQSLLDAFVLRDSADWNNDVEQVDDAAPMKSAAIDWSYDVGSVKKQKKQPKKTEGVMEMFKSVQERNEQCPVCMLFVSKVSLTKHVSAHFDDEVDEPKEVKRKQKKDASIVQFFKK